MITFLIITLLLLAILGVIFGRDLATCLFAWHAGFPLPRYRVQIERNLMLPMKDGVKLATDIYRPVTKEKCPVVITRTIYDKMGKEHDYQTLARYYASQGYVFIMQDVRGKHLSEGEFTPYLNEGTDGHETVTWAGTAPWSNGKVSLTGFSYLGSCAWLAAQYKSPFLKTILPMFTTQNTYHIWIDRGIPYFQGPLFWLSKYVEKKNNVAVTPEKAAAIMRKLPIHNLDLQLSDRIITHYREYLAHIRPDKFWKSLSLHFITVQELDLPAFIVGGWYDVFLRGTLEDFHSMINSPAPSKNRQSVLFIGPWSHNPMQKMELNFGPEANFFSIFLKSLHWCHDWLKEEGPSDNLYSPVNYFLMGKNRWIAAKEWPPRDITTHIYHLAIEKEQRLLSSAPSHSQATSQYIYDPDEPVAFHGKEILGGVPWAAPIDQAEFVGRSDVLLFNSAPLREELSIAGKVKAVLYVSSTGLDTDFCVKLCDIHPNGKVYNLTTGFIRMRYRHSIENPEMMVPGEIYRIEILFQDTANTFLKGHSIQLQITSSDFPTHVRNLNTGLSSEFTNEIAVTEQTIYSGGIYDSLLMLPVLTKY
jgi:putative CocE/NonD family hydrolase